MIGSEVRVRVYGTDSLKTKLRKRVKGKAKAFNRGLKQVGTFLLTKSLEVVPVDTGLLYSTGFTVTRGRGFNAYQETGYDTHYAIYVHEDLNMRHAPGKTAKYLERPARVYRREMAQLMADELKRG